MGEHTELKKKDEIPRSEREESENLKKSEGREIMTISLGSRCQEESILADSILVVYVQIPRRKNSEWLSLIVCSCLSQGRAGHLNGKVPTLLHIM